MLPVNGVASPRRKMPPNQQLPHQGSPLRLWRSQPLLHRLLVRDSLAHSVNIKGLRESQKTSRATAGFYLLFSFLFACLFVGFHLSWKAANRKSARAQGAAPSWADEHRRSAELHPPVPRPCPRENKISSRGFTRFVLLRQFESVQ